MNTLSLIKDAKYTMEKRWSLQQVVLGKLINYV